MIKLMAYISMNLWLLLLWSFYVTYAGWLDPHAGAGIAFAAITGLIHRPHIARFLFEEKREDNESESRSA